jgi:hypothetical protein
MRDLPDNRTYVLFAIGKGHMMRRSALLLFLLAPTFSALV